MNISLNKETNFVKKKRKRKKRFLYHVRIEVIHYWIILYDYNYITSLPVPLDNLRHWKKKGLILDTPNKDFLKNKELVCICII